MTELNCRWTPTANRAEYHKSIHILHRFRSLARHFAATADPHTVPTEVRLTPPLSWSNGSCYGVASAIAAMLATLQHFCRQYVAITIGMFYADRLTMSTWRQELPSLFLTNIESHQSAMIHQLTWSSQLELFKTVLSLSVPIKAIVHR